MIFILSSWIASECSDVVESFMDCDILPDLASFSRNIDFASDRETVSDSDVPGFVQKTVLYTEHLVARIFLMRTVCQVVLSGGVHHSHSIHLHGSR